MKTFYDNLETYIHGLRSLGKTEDCYGDLLIPIILEKLPSHLKTQICKEHGDQAWSLTQLKSAIYKEIQASEAGDIEDVTNNIASTSAFHIGIK